MGVQRGFSPLARFQWRQTLSILAFKIIDLIELVEIKADNLHIIHINFNVVNMQTNHIKKALLFMFG